MGKKVAEIRTPAGNSPAWRPLDNDGFGPTIFRGRRKKRLDPGDFCAVKDGFHIVDICHTQCYGKLVAIMSEAFELPQETWEKHSLKDQVGGVPIKHDLHCIICDSEKPGWEYEEKK